MWQYLNINMAGLYWVVFRHDNRIFEVDVFQRGKGLWYDLRYKEWDHKLDSRSLEELDILFGGVKAFCLRTEDEPPAL